MNGSDGANAVVGFLNLNAFFIQAGIIGIIAWIYTGSFWVGCGVVIGLYIMLAFKKLAWVVIGGFTICWGYIGWSFWGIGGAFILGLIGYGINWSVSQFAQVCSGELDEKGDEDGDKEELIQCPFCAENIKKEATICRFCKSPLTDAGIQSK